MFILKSRVGKGKTKTEKFYTFEKAYDEVKNYYYNYGGETGQKLYKNGARIVCNNEPILNLSIKKV